jgi:acetolactate synthase I/II/III large subunit
MKASDLFVKALESEGVEYVFGIPGEENLDFLESLRQSSIRLVLTRHEQAAGFMAATYGRLTGKTGVCLSTLGPGATNLVTAAAYAQLGAMPMLMITGQKPIKASKQGEFQILDVVDMMHAITKYTRQISSGANIPARVREAFRRAEDERPGAVHLELPEDIAREETGAPVIPRSRFETPRASEGSIRAAVEMIESARHPLLLIGAGANRRQTCRALPAFVEKTGIPFFSTDGIVCLDNGMYKIWFARNYRTPSPNTLLLDNALATMGAGTALGDDGGDAAPGSSRHGGLRRWRLHDELAGMETAVRLG